MATALVRSRASGIQALAKYSDFFVAVAAILGVGMIIIPMPEWGLDILLTLNVTLALTILLITVYTTEPHQFGSFPALLLVTTLFRMALSIAATRLVLLNASAGSIVAAFGSVVLGGNYLVGVVVFIILIIVQYVVVTNGTGRVAEVAARFTLDAMPGKQMAIDADLNAGIIDEVEAQKRRESIQKEADFYGAMDGASKFIRGDNIAGFVMIFVNILGGFIIGMVQRHMEFMTALQTYALLTVGVGLITQIPSLLVSTAAGLMVTKTPSDKDLGRDISTQMFGQPKAINIAAAVCGVLAFIPGMPKFPFILAMLGGLGLARLLKQQAEVRVPETEAADQAPKAPESMTDLLPVDPLEVELGYGLIPLADPKQGGDMLERVTAVRRQAALDLGLLVPAIRVRDNMQLKPNAYIFKLRGIEIARGEIFVGQLLAMNPGTATTSLQGVQTTEPAFGLPATWISDVQQSEAELAGYTVVDPLTVMITHLTEVLRKHASEVLTRQDIQTLIESVKEQSPVIVDELVPELLTLSDVQRALQNLLVERVSIRNMSVILEALADAARTVKDPDVLTEYVRQALCRQITSQYQSPDGMVRVFTLDPSIEQTIAEGIRQTDAGMQLIMEPNMAQQILQATRTQIEQMAALGHQPVALCSPRTRVHFRRLAERMAPSLAVLSFNELAPGVGLETVGMVTLAHEDVEDQSKQYA